MADTNSALIKKMLIFGNRFSLLTASVTPAKIKFCSSLYVMYSAIKGLVPAVDILLFNSDGNETRTLIVNQTSIARLLAQGFGILPSETPWSEYWKFYKEGPGKFDRVILEPWTLDTPRASSAT